MPTVRLVVATLCLLAVRSHRSPAQDHSHHESVSPTGEIGRVSFPTSCSAAAQPDFEKGVALLHSFWYEEATKKFDSALATDHNCAMAHWGQAMSLFHQVWILPDSADRRKALAALNSARNGGPMSARERAYVEALATYFEAKAKAPRDTATSDERLVAYRDAMQTVSRRFPSDDEAAIFFGLAIYAAAPTGDTTFKAERRADSVLFPIAKRNPAHPGVMHYIIHANDNPVLAPLAVDAARIYAQLAPAIPHAQHMPSHIFIRLGLWDDVIASNLTATRSGTVYEQQEKMDGEWWHNLHTMDFLQYAYLQEGRDAEARRLVERVQRIEKLSTPDRPLLRYFQALLEGRQLLENGQWLAAAHLTLKAPRDTGDDWSDAHLTFIRALGAARGGDSALARVEISRLDSLRERAALKNDTSTARGDKVLSQAASAWYQLALGNRDRAADLAHEAAMGESDASETALIPTAELEGELLMSIGRPREAKAAFERSLHRNPNRAHSVFGLASAAAKSGDSVAAGKAYQQYVELMRHADAKKPELATARAFLGSKAVRIY